MVHEYAVRSYIPAAERRARLQADDCKRARGLAAWREKVHAAWDKVRVVKTEMKRPEDLRVGGTISVRIWVDPGPLTSDDFLVQVYVGPLDEDRNIVNGRVIPIEFQTSKTEGGVLFEGSVPCQTSGTQGITVRLVPEHEDLADPHCVRLIRWA
jgi:starch phosphorylase